VKRVIILDIDLHHGNGTQAIAWSINTETARGEEESSARVNAGQVPGAPGLKVFYGSLHDILSFPCEVNSLSLLSSAGFPTYGCHQDGDPALIQAASTSLSGAHDQYLENVHLEPFASEEVFFQRLYPLYKERLLGGARRFLQQTATPNAFGPDETLIFIR
jgi:histone deacetylase HOS3